MAISERIHFFRTLRGMTQKYLGQAVGFPERSADVRMAQYETGIRTPKADMTNNLAYVLDVSPQALNVPDIDSYTGLMHTFFALEDIYGIKVDMVDDRVCLRPDVFNNDHAMVIHAMMCAWYEQARKFRANEITKEEYDHWRYHFPETDTTGGWVKTVPQSISDLLIKKFTK